MKPCALSSYRKKEQYMYIFACTKKTHKKHVCACVRKRLLFCYFEEIFVIFFVKSIFYTNSFSYLCNVDVKLHLT